MQRRRKIWDKGEGRWVAVCDIPDCNRRYSARGLCHTHYMRLRRTGDPLSDRKPGRPPLVSRGASVPAPAPA